MIGTIIVYFFAVFWNLVPRPTNADSYLTWDLMIYAVYLLAYAYVQANIGNLVWNNIRLGPILIQKTKANTVYQIMYGMGN
ncbi:MAG TPA: hypothetical protein EYG51_01215 [Pseudomonadales bacterium]|nr:hypothetical protein [Pseudomonadales bacterium]